MRQLRRMFKAIAGLFRKKAAEQDLDREICAFVEQLIHENVQAGMSPAHARRAALLEIEGEQQLKEKVRNAWAGAWLDRLMLDIHFGTRLLRRNKGFAGAAILMLAIGIGSNTAIFSLLYGVLLKPMPYPEPDRVASIWHTWTAGGFNKLGINAGHVAALRERTRFFDSAGVYQVSSSLISPNEQAERVRTAYATAGVLESFGVTPILGRGFRREDEGQGAPVAILSYALWQRWFHGDPAIFGKSVRIDQRAATVVGVLPADFRLPEDLTGDEATQIWEPLAVNPSADGYQFTAVARLKHGSSLQQAKGELDVLFHGQAEQPNTREDDLRLHVTSIRDDVVSDVKPALWALSSAVAVVLLIVCANTSSLMLTRAMARRKEIALRVALGAEPGRIVRQLLTESMMISLLGGALGIGLAAAALKTIATLAARDVPRLGQATLNLPVLTFTVAISILSALLFGLLPAIHSTRPQLNKALQSEGKAMSANSAKSLWQRLLVIAEVAASMVLVVGAGLLLRSFQRLTHVDPGFHVQKILTAAIELPHFSYPDGPRANLFCRSLLDRVRAMPGVISAGFTTSPPLTGIGG
ncbi:MAG TPA: ABC transporter permease, partial [Candidatus Angelobacter sp.]|nr:ABC transporter permease [Candidatus Angelobacter sp.]